MALVLVYSVGRLCAVWLLQSSDQTDHDHLHSWSSFSPPTTCCPSVLQLVLMLFTPDTLTVTLHRSHKMTGHTRHSYWHNTPQIHINIYTIYHNTSTALIPTLWQLSTVFGYHVHTNNSSSHNDVKCFLFGVQNKPTHLMIDRDPPSTKQEDGQAPKQRLPQHNTL